MCGCPRSAHRPTIMSVPLTPRAPLYPIPPAIASIATTYATSTYCRDDCDCGHCCEYLADA